MSRNATQNTGKSRGGRPENLKPWKPGQSGNPGGRPKSKHISEALRELLKNGDADAIAEKLVTLAKDGDVQAIKEAADRTEGKAPQTVNVNADISISSRRDRVRDLISGITGKAL